jgi:type IV pilus assembly protein PilY1
MSWQAGDRAGEGRDRVAWKAIFGNGYNSLSRKAVLFVVDLGSGAVRMILLPRPRQPHLPVTTAWATSWLSTVGAPTAPVGQGVYVAVTAWRTRSMRPTSAARCGIRPGKRDLGHHAGVHHGAPDNNNNQVYRQPITGGMTAVTGPGWRDGAGYRQLLLRQ